MHDRTKLKILEAFEDGKLKNWADLKIGSSALLHLAFHGFLDRWPNDDGRGYIYRISRRGRKELQRLREKIAVKEAERVLDSQLKRTRQIINNFHKTFHGGEK